MSKCDKWLKELPPILTLWMVRSGQSCIRARAHVTAFGRVCQVLAVPRAGAIAIERYHKNGNDTSECRESPTGCAEDRCLKSAPHASNSASR